MCYRQRITESEKLYDYSQAVNNFMIFILLFVENSPLYDIHDYSVLLRKGSNPADINEFRSHEYKFNTYFRNNNKIGLFMSAYVYPFSIGFFPYKRLNLGNNLSNNKHTYIYD